MPQKSPCPLLPVNVEGEGVQLDSGADKTLVLFSFAFWKKTTFCFTLVLCLSLSLAFSVVAREKFATHPPLPTGYT